MDGSRCAYAYVWVLFSMYVYEFRYVCVWVVVEERGGGKGGCARFFASGGFSGWDESALSWHKLWSP